MKWLESSLITSIEWNESLGISINRKNNLLFFVHPSSDCEICLPTIMFLHE